jgi:insulin-like growth factor 2 receptor
MAEDIRSNLDYYINVCRGYFPGDAKYQCRGSSGIGGCQVDKINKNTYNMGYVVSGPALSPLGHVSLRYTGGDRCHKKYDRSTRINFFCSDVHVSMGENVFSLKSLG